MISISGRVLLYFVSQVLHSIPSDNSGVKIKMVARFWWNYTDRGKPNYGTVVYLTWGVQVVRCPNFFLGNGSR